jgi:hypothetical protein
VWHWHASVINSPLVTRQFLAHLAKDIHSPYRNSPYLLKQAGLLKWQCIVVMHRLYSSTKNCFVVNNDEFKAFLKAVVENPASKVIIHILMDNPNAQAAKKTQVYVCDWGLLLFAWQSHGSH